MIKVLITQEEPFRKVKKGEPWGSRNDIAKHEIPAARLVLFTDGSIEFVHEIDFRKKYNDLILQLKNNEISQKYTSMIDLKVVLE